MALERLIETSILDNHFFDEMFEEQQREIARMHRDMRTAMLRLTPPDLISEGSDELSKQLKLSENPIITNKDGTKDFQMQLDVSTFKPDEIKVKTVGKELSVEACHEDKNDHSRIVHRFSRHYSLPKGVNADELASTLSKDGVLTIKGPFNADNAIEEPPAKKQKEEAE